jgi:hypothetical protein
MRANCESLSNEINESDSQNQKHSEQRILIFRGIWIDSTKEQQNAFESMRVNCEPLSISIISGGPQNEIHDG